MSGAQFIRQEDYDGITMLLGQEPAGGPIWLNATDPAQVWGKLAALSEDKNFVSVQGTVVALRQGQLAAVMERQGSVLKVFLFDDIEKILEVFTQDFRQKRIYPGKQRLVLKEYPQKIAEALKAVGYQKEMQDYVLYRT